jgi:hypothetical protein
LTQKTVSRIRYIIMASSLSNISVRELKKAITLRERIEALERRLAAILGDATPAAAPGRRGRRKMSASARAKIAAAQRKRWAKQRKGVKGPKKGRRKMSAAARARIAASARARWAKVKARGGRTLAG